MNGWQHRLPSLVDFLGLVYHMYIAVSFGADVYVSIMTHNVV